MSLASGTRLGPYEIVSQIGAGGMGEVYKATDTRLQRTIAIKVLPQHLADDPQRLARFQREAQTISSLNHPHICALHDVGDDAGTRFLVMEYVEGQSLDERLERGPLPLEEALQYASQIADALDRAHRQGIVHRDLKPGNVMITKSGVKLLDFGLAKLSTDTVRGSSQSMLPTQGGSKPLTEEGAILGTFRYMAPEQLEGKEVDARTDIYALCLVLYEMLTANPVFEATTQASLIAAILKDKPRPLTELQPITPPQLDRIVQTGLEKDPDKRWQSAREVKHALEWIGLADSDADSVPAAQTSRVWKSATLLLAIALISGITLVALWRTDLGGPSPLLPLGRFEVDLGSREFVSAGTMPAFSPDGTELVVVAEDADGESRLLSYRLDQGVVTTLTGTEGATAPTFSPDGQWLSFNRNGQLWRKPVAGGAATSLDGATLFAPSWGEDGYIVTNALYTGLTRTPVAGGQPQVLTQLAEGEITHRFPQVLPGGRWVLFTSHTELGDFDQAHIEAVSVDGTERKVLIEGGSFGRYVPSGHLVYVNGGTAYAVEFDLGRMETHGAPVAILFDVEYDPDSGLATMAFASTGTGVYRQRLPADQRLSLVLLHEDGETESLPNVEPDSYGVPKFSPDGTKLAVGRNRVGTGWDIWVADIARGTFQPLTSGGSVSLMSYAWSADGHFIYYPSADGFRRILVDRPGDAELVAGLEELPNLATVSEASLDGHWLIGNTFNPGTSVDIWYASLDDTGKVIPAETERFRPSEVEQSWPSLSSDVQWLAFRRPADPLAVHVAGFPEGGLWSVAQGNNPLWSHSSNRLFFLGGETLYPRIMVVDYTVEGGAFRADTPRPWGADIQLANTLPNAMSPYSVRPDGDGFAVLLPAVTGVEEPRTQVTFLQNFFDEVRRQTGDSEGVP